MARGLTNALRLALAGASGAAEGYGAKQERVKKDEQLRQALERQAAQDAAAVRSEERQAISAGMMPAERLSRMTMPGATPLPSMEPALRQKIGGTEYVYAPEINAAEKHRADVMKKRETLAANEQERSAVVTALEQVEAGSKRLPKEKAEAWSRLDSGERSARVREWVGANTPRREPSTGGLTAKQQQDRALREGAAEALFNSPPDQQTSDRLGRAFGRLRNAYTRRGINKPPRALMLEVVEGLGLMKPVKTEEADPLDWMGQTPAFSNDQDLQEARDTWDEAAARTSVEVATARLGPRP